MRNESCRKCGNNMKPDHNCVVCATPIDFVCHNCGITSQKQIHSKCVINSIPVMV
jgi:hypothetical protein